MPREPFWVTLGAFSSLWGTFELLATPGSKINDFTWEGVPCFETYFCTILVNFSYCSLGVFLGCSGSLFWSSGGFWGHLWGSFSVVFLKSLGFF